MKKMAFQHLVLLAGLMYAAENVFHQERAVYENFLTNEVYILDREMDTEVQIEFHFDTEGIFRSFYHHILKPKKIRGFEIVINNR